MKSNTLKNAMLYNPLVKTLGVNNNKNIISLDVSKSIPQKVLDLNNLLTFISNFKNTSKNIIESESNKNNFITKKKDELIPLSFGESDNLEYLPSNLKNIFDGVSLHRFGMISYKPKNPKLDYLSKSSFVLSLLTCLKNNFILLSQNEQLNYANTLRKNLVNLYQGIQFNENNYKSLGWNQKELIKDLINFNISDMLIRSFVDYLHINLFVIDYESDLINFYGQNGFIMHKKNIFLLMHDSNTFEPIYINDKSFIDSENDIIHYLLENPEFIDFKNCNFNKNDFDDDLNQFDINEEILDKYLNKKEVKIDMQTKMLERDIIKSIRRAEYDNTLKEDNPHYNSDKEEDKKEEVEAKDEEDEEYNFEDKISDNNSNLTKSSGSKTKVSFNPKVSDKKQQNNESSYSEVDDSDTNSVISDLTDTVIDGEQTEKAYTVNENSVFLKKKNNDKKGCDSTTVSQSINKNKLREEIKVKKTSKLNELQEAATKLNIELTYTENKKLKNKTRDMLFEEINKFLE